MVSLAGGLQAKSMTSYGAEPSKMAAICYYGNVILRLQQYSHRLNLFFFTTGKGPHFNTDEKFCTCGETSKNNQLSDQNTMEQNAIFDNLSQLSIIHNTQNYYKLSDSICSPPIAILTYKIFHILYIN